MVYHHFRDNPLVGEYFGMVREQAKTAIPSAVPTVSRFVPHAGAVEGVRVALSYHHFDKGTLEEDRCIAMLGLVRDGTETARFVDAEFIDFLKLAERTGLALKLPADVRLAAFEDLYHVFPLIRHRTHTAAEETLDVLRSFVALWRNPERVLSFSLSVITGDAEVRLSLLGGCGAIAEWLGRFGFPPQDVSPAPPGYRRFRIT
jgi:hypothetical protein